MKPLVLLVPGLLCDARTWLEVVARLPGEALDTLVADVAQGDTIEQIAAQAWDLVLAQPEAATRRLVIAGFSMGGYVALAMLADPRRPVDALALVATSSRPETPESAALRAKAIALMERDFARAVDNIVQFGSHERFRADAAAVASLRTTMLDIGAATALRQQRAILQRADRRALLDTLALPCTVLLGEDDRIVAPEASAELAARIPGARLLRLPQCGHFLPLEQPQAVADALRALALPHNDQETP